jgi:hypothetical protein
LFVEIAWFAALAFVGGVNQVFGTDRMHPFFKGGFPACRADLMTSAVLCCVLVASQPPSRFPWQCAPATWLGPSFAWRGP